MPASWKVALMSGPASVTAGSSVAGATGRNGGWGQAPNKALKKGDDGDAVVALKRRLIAENYLSADSLTGDLCQDWFWATLPADTLTDRTPDERLN